MPQTKDPNLSDLFADVFVAHAVDLLRFTETVRADVLALLRGLEQELVHAIADADVTGVTRTAYVVGRQEALLQQVRKIIGTTYRDVGSNVGRHLVDLSEVAQARVVKMVNEVFEAEITKPVLTPADLRELVTDSMIQGHPQKAWWGKQADDLQHRFAAQIRQGVAQGETNDQLVKRIRGTATGRKVTATTADGETVSLPEYAGGVMDVSRNEATALVRTAVQTISNDVNAAVFADNADVLKGQQWLSTLDSRTSQICRGLSMAAWDFDGNPLPQSPVKIKFPGPPPAHFNCRSVLIPITKRWEELAGQRIGGVSEIPESTQASMDGQVAGNLTYEQWLKRKPVEFQQEVLGQEKWQLWSDGKLSLSQMIDQSGNPLSMAELKRKAGVE